MRQPVRPSKVNVEFSDADCNQWPWPEDCYDSVVAIFVQFADPPLRARLFANMIRSLKRADCWCCRATHQKQTKFTTGGPPFRSHQYPDAMLRNAFASLHIVELREYETDPTEGTQHHGQSALISLVARK